MSELNESFCHSAHLVTLQSSRAKESRGDFDIYGKWQISRSHLAMCTRNWRMRLLTSLYGNCVLLDIFFYSYSCTCTSIIVLQLGVTMYMIIMG